MLPKAYSTVSPYVTASTQSSISFRFLSLSPQAVKSIYQLIMVIEYALDHQDRRDCLCLSPEHRSLEKNNREKILGGNRRDCATTFSESCRAIMYTTQAAISNCLQITTAVFRCPSGQPLARPEALHLSRWQSDSLVFVSITFLAICVMQGE